ncbi:2OG-Fe dioxygenase family protein [Agrobacterium cavarae]|uniref:2OG-Fe dioxygenase family protein n=1 Tax=Agrobacterium cavarae TaxID=2528239 RepID=UPI003FCF4DD4
MSKIVHTFEPSSGTVQDANGAGEIVAAIYERGWAVIAQGFYALQESEKAELQTSYGVLNRDPYGDTRCRSYFKATLDVDSGRLTRAEDQTYSQTYKANPIDGGKVRVFDTIDDEVLAMTAFQRLVMSNLALMTASYIFKKRLVTIGVHMVRYYTEMGKPTFSSPIWLHKDDEPLVVLNVINESRGLVGGDTVLARDLKSVERVVHLKPYEGAVLTKKLAHMVTPMEAPAEATIGFRDILLTTLEEADDVVQPNEPAADWRAAS